MAGRSTPAHTDAALADEVPRQVTQEGQPPLQVMASSLELHLALPATVHAALRDIEALGTAEDRHNVLRSIARAVVSVQYEVARRKVAEEVRLDGEGRTATDDDILAEAVRATAKGR